MPQSLIINLVTQSSVASKHLQGHSLQQLFFTLVNVVDPELGNVLQRDKKNASYSLSALQFSPAEPGAMSASVPSPVSSLRSPKVYPIRQSLSASQKTESSKLSAEISQNVSKETASLDNPAEKRTLQFFHSSAAAAHTSCWWRISFLDDALFGHLLFLWNQLRDEVFFLGNASVKISSVSPERSHYHRDYLSWVSSCSYRDLYEQASAYDRDIHLHFVTPTTFEKGGYITPLPTVEAVFQPLRKYWNRHSGLVFAPSLIDSIVPINFDIKTQPVQTVVHNALQTVIACTGHISFRVGGHGDPLITKRLNALADFTQYCPVGSNTRFGMGVIKRVSSQDCAVRVKSPTLKQEC